ncbi:10064_t:CDS:2 [Funneliformis mosseae]|uniref:10064_t:CDS:1 n=1 Tax=Funneliformis mosseae TaxID=27381 RepID=A0A9N9DEH1_FUNMO|nr:10064_t:CDS:2 [Funneliformis mosseae]
MVNIEKTLKVLEARVNELDQSNKGLLLQSKNLEEKIRKREEAEIKHETINNLEEKIRKQEEAEIKHETINNLEEKISEREEVSKEKREIINELEERISSPIFKSQCINNYPLISF